MMEMDNEFNEDLHQVLDRASADIGTPVLAARAFRSARRRRTRRRGAAAAVLSSGLVVAVVVATQLGGSTSVAPPPTAPSISPMPLPTDGPSVVDPAKDGQWDPRDVDSLPAADPGIAPTLPEVVDPPDSSPLVTDEPIDAAVLAVVQKDVVQVLGIDGSWRSVVPDVDDPLVHLSPAGTKLVVEYYADVELGATVYDLGTGSTQQLPFPAGYVGNDFQSWRFTDEDTLLFDDGGGGFVIDLGSGDVERVPFPTQFFSWAVDATGAVVESASIGTPPVVTDWASGQRRAVKMSGTLEGIRVSDASVAGTSYDGRPYAVVIADRQTLTTQSALRLSDGRGKYSGAFSNGGLNVVALAEDGTVLLRVAALGEGGGSFRIAAWEPGSGRLSLVSSIRASFSATFAEGLLRVTGDVEPEQTGPVSAPPIDAALVQPTWDPDDVAELPQADLALPEVLAPTGGPGAADGRGLAVADVDGLTWVLDASGVWTSTEHPEPALESFGSTTAVAPSGAEVVFVGESALWRRDVTGSEWREVSYPDGFRVAADFGASVSAYDDGRILLGQYNRFWIIDPGGEATRLPFDGLDEVIPAGDDVVAERFDEPLTQYVEEWRNGEVVSSTDSLALQSLQRPVADASSIAVSRGRTGYSNPPGPTESDGLLALDRNGLTTRAFLPVPSRASYYSDGGGLTPVGWLDADTVLVAVRPRNDFDTTWLVTWDVETGDLRRVSSYTTGLTVEIASGTL